MTDPTLPADPKTALYTVCLFLAQSGEPHTELGYDTQSSAFEAIGDKFGVPSNTVKNGRDAFDHFTDSKRVGWVKASLPSRLQVVFNQYEDTTREKLHEISLKIMKLEWEKLGKEAIDTMEEQEQQAAITQPPATLPDLEECQRLSKERAAKIPVDKVCAPSPEVWEQIITLYNTEVPSDTATVVGDSSMVIRTGKDKSLTISSQEFPRCWSVRPYVLGILKYEEKIDELANELGFLTRSSVRAKDEIFKKLPSENWEVEISAQDVSAIKDAVRNKLSLNVDEQERFLKFLTDPKWSGVSKTLERSDWPVSAIVGVGDWLANASTRRGELSIALAKSDAFNDLMQLSGSTDQTKSKTALNASSPGAYWRRKCYLLRSTRNRKVQQDRKEN